MRPKIRILFTLLISSFAIAVAALGQIGTTTVDPPDPTSRDSVTVVVQQFGGCTLPPDVSRSGFQIAITLHAFACGAPPPLDGTPESVDLGTLPPGTYDVLVTYGNQTSSMSFQVLDSTGIAVQQSIGSSAGGTTVNVIVAGIFCQGRPTAACAPPSITFGGVPATNVTVIDFSHFRATTPPHAPGAVQVAVNGDSLAKSAYSFRYYDPNAFPSSKFFEMVLVPVILNAPAANGSNWVTDVSIRNDNEYPIEPWHAIGASRSVAPLQPFRFGSETNFPYGLFFFVPREASAGLNFHTIVRDTSRSETDWGTEIPVVHEAEFSRRNLELLDIPVDSRYRTMLRIYTSQTSSTGHDTVGVDLYSMDDGHDLRSFYLPLEHTIGCIDSVSCSDIPIAAAVSDLTSGLQAQRIGVRVGPWSSGPIWAFVTITNNETQHVTVVSPH